MTGTSLYLVKPLGFSVSNRHLKRAGLDYWYRACVSLVENLEEFLSSSPHRFFFFSSKASAPYTSIEFQENDCLIFGSERTGLPSHFWNLWPEKFYTIPTRPLQEKSELPSPSSPLFSHSNTPRVLDSGCLNLSVAVSIVLYEALRQMGFQGLKP